MPAGGQFLSSVSLLTTTFHGLFPSSGETVKCKKMVPFEVANYKYASV